jgi:hypothetical protein
MVRLFKQQMYKPPLFGMLTNKKNFYDFRQVLKPGRDRTRACTPPSFLQHALSCSEVIKAACGFRNFVGQQPHRIYRCHLHTL